MYNGGCCFRGSGGKVPIFRRLEVGEERPQRSEIFFVKITEFYLGYILTKIIAFKT